ncbi:MAG: hypothetical protein II117_07940 [Clostridia bacterium]|nr:hypothetical protein [Clostridia bacterium]
MRNTGARIREYLRESADRKLTIGRFTVSRLAIFGFAAVILLTAIVALGILLFGKRDTGLTFKKADVISGYEYRMKDGRLSYRTSDRIYTYDCVANKSTYFAAPRIEGYDSSASMTVVYAGSQFQIQGADSAQMLSNGTILDVRAGTDYAALLYKAADEDRDERFILIIDKDMHSINRLSFKDSEVVAFDFLNTGSTELLWVSTMDVGQFTEESIVRIYDCANEGAMVHYSAPFYNQSIYNLYLSDRCLFMVGTHSIIRYDREDSGGFSAERDRVRVYGSTIVDFSAAGETAYFIALPSAAEGEQNSLVRLITISETDDLWSNVMQMFMPAPIVGAFLHAGSICVFTAENFLQYSFAGKELNDIEPEYAPVAAFEYGEDGFLIVAEQGCYRVTLD